jgi:transposase-like protein
VREIDALGYLAVGRRYGVSDNAIRKWRRAYEAALEETPGADAATRASRPEGRPAAAGV